MARPGFVKRLAEVRKRLKVRLYRELGALLQGDLSPDRAGYASDLFQRVNDLEREDGNGALERLLTGLPDAVTNQIRQELRRSFDEKDVSEGRKPVRG